MEFEPVHVISWSGGHDSTTMMHYLLNGSLRDEENVRIIFIDTTMMLPETHCYINEVIELWSLQGIMNYASHHEDFWTLLKRYKRWPNINQRWCNVLLKLRVLKKYYKNLKKEGFYPIYVYIGVGIHDSVYRRGEYTVDERVRNITKRQDLPLSVSIIERFPLRLWTDEMKVDYMRKHNIPVNPAYGLYGSSGCIFCPFHHKSFYLRLRLHRPELFYHLVELEKLIGKDINSEFSIAELDKLKALDDFF